MTVGIHQCNLMPYEGIVDRARHCDRFVILTWAQYSPGNYHNRFNCLGKWYTMSVHRGLEPLVMKHYAAPWADWEAIKRRIAPHYAGLLTAFDDCIDDSLATTNIAIIRRLLALLGIGCEVVLDYETPLTGTARLVDLCRHYGATTYLSGPSGPKYMDMEAFTAAGIDVEVQEPTAGRAAVEVLAEVKRGGQSNG